MFHELYSVVFIAEPNDLSTTRVTTVTTSTTQTASVTLKPNIPTPHSSHLPTKVEGVRVTRTVQGSSPALRVSWSAVSGSGITYTVCYSTTSGTQSDPPSGADCSTSQITGTSTTLGPLNIGTTYYIWVAAVSSDERGAYSARQQARTHNGKFQTSSSTYSADMHYILGTGTLGALILGVLYNV